MADHSRRFLALSLRNMDVDFWKKAVYASYPLTALDMQRDGWKAIFESKHGLKMLRPIQLLGAADVTPEEEALVKTPTQRAELTHQIPASIGWIYKFWAPHRRALAERTSDNTFEQEAPRQSRNAPCSCGSGRKFKKCCGKSTEQD